MGTSRFKACPEGNPNSAHISEGTRESPEGAARRDLSDTLPTRLGQRSLRPRSAREASGAVLSGGEKAVGWGSEEVQTRCTGRSKGELVSPRGAEGFEALPGVRGEQRGRLFV